jgi:hypothetical protein
MEREDGLAATVVAARSTNAGERTNLNMNTAPNASERLHP